MSVPRDRFTPHGYLDNPFHTRNDNPSGVIRSVPGIGFGWHYPALAGGYGFREIYRASLALALVVDGRVLRLPEHFPGLHADLHTRNRVRYRWQGDRIEGTALFHRVGEHALACRVDLDAAGPVTLVALLTYTRHLGAAGVWGESGLVGRVDEGQLVLQGFEDGEAFALAADRDWRHAGAGGDADDAFVRTPALAGGDHTVVTGKRGDSVTLHGAATFELAGGADHLDLILARGRRRDLALAESRSAFAARDLALCELEADDDRFWRQAPRLEGDWPEHWRRGAIYDLETLRMMVRPPTGIYRHPWDAMQIQAPRVVLAEAAIDALLLSYADPAAARELLLGTFLDAPAANVPCSREDGSYNMVGANGSECGTAPEWGYPFRVAEHLWRLEPDGAWPAAIYPPMARFLAWWLEHRCDDDGYLVYDNSWESGQDLSARFGPQKEGGGSTIRSLRPVDLQAAAADACRVLAHFAALSGLDDDAARWRARRDDFAARVAELWHDGHYRDFDARVGWSDVWDVMQLAPVALSLAPAERVEALAGTIDALADVPYLWPMFVWTATDAAQAAGRHELAADIARATLERAWSMWDAREPSATGTLPGVTCEYWGSDGRFGAEGYGWGAFGLHLLFATILGVRPHADGIELLPNLPQPLRIPGRRYRVRNLFARGHRFDLTLEVAGEGDEARLSLHAHRPIFAADTGAAARIEIVLPFGQRDSIAIESAREHG